ncbi:hypothetical protein [Pseudomonas asplenii]|uniref:hypothetical protein n=1 Tax=Pseudomonas asplenii TaxID=53407 RepID=UPI0022340CE2|nr:hypothetical protein [Pseudomonas asplenii]UZE28454.1 hypothetical protein LOY63_24585 [Pseudomonas asplenii]
MPRNFSLACLAMVLTTTLAGCATPTATQSANIDYSQRRYESTRFDKPGVALPVQASSFKADIDGCEVQAQKHYEESLASSKKLAQLYGQGIKPEVLLDMKRKQVVSCMTGKGGSGQDGKGWTIAE